MPRALPTELDLAQLDRKRKPGFKLFIYDLRSTSDTIRNIVVGDPLATLTGPRDFSEEVLEVTMTENASDYLDGLGSQMLDVAIVDKSGIFDPLTGSEGRWIRQGNVVRIVEGDRRINEADWVTTFTGEIAGQAGVLRSRAIGGSGESRITFRVYDRSARFFKYKRTSANFLQGTTYQTMALDIAQNDMNLDLAEINFSSWGSAVTGHTSTQFVQEEPLVSIAKIMFRDGVLPFFDGEGKLTQTDGAISKAPSRIYTDNAQNIAVERPQSEDNPINRVLVVGLSKDMTEILQPDQVLRTLRVTSGYFTQDESIDVYFSDDRSIVAKNTHLVVIQSVNGGISFLGGGEEYTAIPAPGGEGFIGGNVSFETGYSPYVILFLTGVYVGLAAIPDEVTAEIVGVTIPVGRIVQAAALAIVLLLMSKIGRGDYELWGQPFEYVFLEVRALAQVALTPYNERREQTINNHLIQTKADARAAARRVLLREQAKGNQRAVTMFHDLLLIPDDVFEHVDGRTYMIKSIKRTLIRNADTIVASLDCFETTPGVTP